MDEGRYIYKKKKKKKKKKREPQILRGTDQRTDLGTDGGDRRFCLSPPSVHSTVPRPVPRAVGTDRGTEMGSNWKGVLPRFLKEYNAFLIVDELEHA